MIELLLLILNAQMDCKLDGDSYVCPPFVELSVPSNLKDADLVLSGGAAKPVITVSPELPDKSYMVTFSEEYEVKCFVVPRGKK